ncbi:hypothetical protein HYPSUDRAFT_59070 [Hypholoma sublateritium FD-334 SS-4]|uniref:peptidylprolyl isomerase n=1 Tax=Hypholoma sublateritium (strain FD-334 SS-4) TaxID=945553 RepID=A0A0D2NEA8_HYPSF|nr:hypothetical protein HYPSUDRAFT_59070 [Hypholoma sublateritium FD-334 SS-4]
MPEARRNKKRVTNIDGEFRKTGFALGFVGIEEVASGARPGRFLVDTFPVKIFTGRKAYIWPFDYFRIENCRIVLYRETFGRDSYQWLGKLVSHAVTSTAGFVYISETLYVVKVQHLIDLSRCRIDSPPVEPSSRIPAEFIRLKSGLQPISPPHNLHLSSALRIGDSKEGNSCCEIILHFADESPRDDSITPIVEDIQLSKATICTFSATTHIGISVLLLNVESTPIWNATILHRGEDDIILLGNYIKAVPLRGDEVIIQDVTIGDGNIIKTGSKATVWYTSKIVETDHIYENVNATNSAPAILHIGSGDNIQDQGWEEGMIGMHSGGRRIMTIPPSKAYGSKGSGPVPPNSTVQIVSNVHVRPSASGPAIAQRLREVTSLSRFENKSQRVHLAIERREDTPLERRSASDAVLKPPQKRLEVRPDNALLGAVFVLTRFSMASDHKNIGMRKLRTKQIYKRSRVAVHRPPQLRRGATSSLRLASSCLQTATRLATLLGVPVVFAAGANRLRRAAHDELALAERCGRTARERVHGQAAPSIN